MPTLDHLILLVPSLDPAALAPFSSAGLTILPGGTHADNVTANVLVPLPDGVYLELIAFVHPDSARRVPHWWGNKADGWIDWSLAPPGTTAEVLAEVEARAGTQPYDAPVSGGRVTPDGRKLEWKVTFPKLEAGQKRGVRPFWCEDVSPREWRVSSRRLPPPSLTLAPNVQLNSPFSPQAPSLPSPHPNGASRIAELVLLATPGARAAYVAKLAHVFGPALEGTRHVFELAAPAVGDPVKVLVREPESEAEREWVAERGEGLYEVAIAGAKEETVVGEEAGARIRFVI